MEVITIESGAFKQLVEKLDAISEQLQLIEHPGERDDESWVVSNEICRFLKISDRTLQRLRTNGKITYSCLGGKYYYQIGQIKRLLTDHLIKSTDDRRQDLIDHHRQNSTKKK